jgi:hypothetical protein
MAIEKESEAAGYASTYDEMQENLNLNLNPKPKPGTGDREKVRGCSLCQQL